MGARFLLGDGDTGWHIRTGEWILANGRVPDRDIFSFTKAGETWYAWEWLWDVIFGWLHQQWGMAAVVLGSLLILCVCARMLYGMVRERCGDSLIAIAVTFLALAASSIHWLARPHLFTLLFVLVILPGSGARGRGPHTTDLVAAASDDPLDEFTRRFLRGDRADRDLCRGRAGRLALRRG
jgi:hypothetical protein